MNELGVTALGHTHLLYLKLPERKQAIQSRGQLFLALISVTDLQESGSGLHVSFKGIYLSLDSC